MLLKGSSGRLGCQRHELRMRPPLVAKFNVITVASRNSLMLDRGRFPVGVFVYRPNCFAMSRNVGSGLALATPAALSADLWVWRVEGLSVLDPPGLRACREIARPIFLCLRLRTCAISCIGHSGRIPCTIGDHVAIGQRSARRLRSRAHDALSSTSGARGLLDRIGGQQCEVDV